MTGAVLSADIGTSSLKAALIQDDGTVLATAQEAIPYKQGPSCYLAALSDAAFTLRKAVARQGSPSPYIRAVSISGNGPSLANSAGSYLWNAPYSPSDIAEEISGMEPGFSLFLPRIIHVKHHLRDMWSAPEGVFSVPEYVVYQLTGTRQTLLPNPRYTGAYWDIERLCMFGIPPKKMPPFATFGESAGPLLEDMAEQLFIEQDEPPQVFCGGPDFTIALIGTDTLSPGKICDRAGTSEGINLCTETPLYGPDIRTLPSPVSPLWNASVLIPDSGKRFTDWKYENLFGDIPYRKCVDYLMERPESDGFAVLLDIAFGVRAKLAELLKTANANGIAPYKSMTCTGGQAKTPAWLQLKADVLGIPIKVPSTPDAELVGDAVCALFGLGDYASVEEAARNLAHTTTVYHPDRIRREKYEEMYAARQHE